MSKFSNQIKHIYEQLAKKKGLILALSAVVVFVTTYMLILPAMTLEKDEAVSQGGIDLPAAEQTVAAKDGAESPADQQQDSRDQQPDDAENADTEATAGDTGTDDTTEEHTTAHTDVNNEGNDSEESEGNTEDKTNNNEESEHTLTGKDSKYKVSVTYGEDAEIPAGASLSVRELNEDSDEYKRAKDLVSDTTGFAALDISIIDKSGNIVEPSSAVDVVIEMDELPEGISSDDLTSSLAVHHIIEDNAHETAEVVADVNDKNSTITVDDNTATAEFSTESFSTYTISWGGGIVGQSIQNITSGDYIVYARDAHDGNYYALVPSTNTNSDLASFQLTNNNGVLSYSGNNNLYWHVAVNGNGDNRTFTMSYSTGNSTYYAYPEYANLYDGGTSNLRVRTNSYTWQNWANHIFCSGDTFMRSYNGTFQVWNQNNGNWQNMTNIYFAKVSDTKQLTVHYGYMDGNTFVELSNDEDGDVPAGTTVPEPSQYGDQWDLEKNISGYRYVTTRLNNPTNGREISSLLYTDPPNKSNVKNNYENADLSAYPSYTNSVAPSSFIPKWRYRQLSSADWNPTGENSNISNWGYSGSQWELGNVTGKGVTKPVSFADSDNDIYVIYEKGSMSGGSGGPDDTDLGALDAPATDKQVAPNLDGTYDVALSVKGEKRNAESSTKANVVIVLDTSWSMYEKDTGNGQSRLAVAKSAIGSLADKLFALNANDSDTIELAFVSFAQRVRNEEEMRTIYSGTNASSFKSMINGLDCASGTNWDDALYAANHIYFNDNDQTYIVFITDGDPISCAHPYGTYSDWDGGTYYNGRSNNEYALAAKNQADLIVGNNKTLYTIGAFGNISNLRAIGGTYLGQANNTTAINGYFDSIISDIQSTLGYQDVTITDGITDLAHTALVNGSMGNFRYYRKGGKNSDGSEKYNSTANDGKGELWTDAPEATFTHAAGDENKDKVVTWALGEDFQLEEGVTYTVSFTVWPAQEAYDILADLNNGKKTWDSLTPEMQKNFKRTEVSEGKYVYSVRTNTHQEVSYKTVRTETINGQTHTTVSEKPTTSPINDPAQTMGLDESKVKVRKEWDVSLDPSQLTKFLTENPNYKAELVVQATDAPGITDVPVTITPELTYAADGKTVTDASWPEGEAYIAPGVMISKTHAIEKGIIKADGTHPYSEVTYNNEPYIVLETGHTYGFDEVNSDWHFELHAETHHPMVVDGTEKDITFKKEGGETIATATGKSATLVATNKLRSGVNIIKNVVDANGNAVNDDSTFYVKLTLTDKTGKAIRYEDYLRDSDYTVGKVIVEKKHIDCGNGSSYWFIRAKADENAKTYTYYSLNEDGSRQIDQDLYPIWYNYYAAYTEEDNRINGVGNWTLDSMWESGEVKAIKQGQLLQLKNVPYGTNVVLTEVKPVKDGDGNITGYTEVAVDETFGNYKLTGIAYSHEGEAWNGTADFNHSYKIAVTNRVTEKELYFRKADIKSKGETDESKIVKLDGAVFELSKVQNNVSTKLYFDTRHDNKVMSQSEVEEKVGVISAAADFADKIKAAGISETFTFNNDGLEAMLKLPLGTYKLKEVSAPTGYIITSGEMSFSLSSSGVTVDDEEEFIAAGTFTPAGSTTGTSAEKPLITVYNEPGAELPHTGGIGTSLFYIIGALFVIASAGALAARRHSLNIAK